MAESPADLAVAFRSFGRRLDESLAPIKNDSEALASVSPLRSELEQIIASAADSMRVQAPSGDVSATGRAVAAAIESTPSDAWDADRLNRLRKLALDAGAVLRRIDAAVESARSR
jgi:hypothetical protein